MWRNPSQMETINMILKVILIAIVVLIVVIVIMSLLKSSALAENHIEELKKRESGKDNGKGK